MNTLPIYDIKYILCSTPYDKYNIVEIVTYRDRQGGVRRISENIDDKG